MNTAPERVIDSGYADVWADEFVRINGGDKDVMTAWFDAAMTAATTPSPYRSQA